MNNKKRKNALAKRRKEDVEGKEARGFFDTAKVGYDPSIQSERKVLYLYWVFSDRFTRHWTVYGEEEWGMRSMAGAERETKSNKDVIGHKLEDG